MLYEVITVGRPAAAGRARPGERARSKRFEDPHRLRGPGTARARRAAAGGVRVATDPDGPGGAGAADAAPAQPGAAPGPGDDVITSYSIHYTKLYETTPTVSSLHR